MYVGGFSQAQAEDGFSAEEQSYPQNDAALLEMELQRHLEIHEMVHVDASNWQEIAANFNSQTFLAAADIFPPPPPPPPLLADFFHSLPHSAAEVYAHQNGDGGGDGVANLDFTAAEIGGKIGDGIKPVSSEKHRRVVLKDKYLALHALVPMPTKTDRASIVADAIGYIKELKMTVAELKGLVERKRCARERLKRPKVEEEHYDGSSSLLRSSWLHRKTKNTEVDVRIVDDEITVKLVQQKRINCLLFVSKVLDELHLDLHHVAGGLVGDYYSYLFNSKIGEGSIVYASAVANKLIEVVDKQYAAAVAPTTTY